MRAGDSFRSCAFSRRGNLLITGGSSTSDDGRETATVIVWAAATLEESGVRASIGLSAECVAAFGNGDEFVVGSMDGVLTFWQGPSLNDRGRVKVESAERKGGRILSVAASPDGKTLAIAVGTWVRGGGWGNCNCGVLMARQKNAQSSLIARGQLHLWLSQIMAAHWRQRAETVRSDSGMYPRLMRSRSKPAKNDRRYQARPGAVPSASLGRVALGEQSPRATRPLDGNNFKIGLAPWKIGLTPWMDGNNFKIGLTPWKIGLTPWTHHFVGRSKNVYGRQVR